LRKLYSLIDQEKSLIDYLENERTERILKLAKLQKSNVSSILTNILGMSI